MSVEDLEYIERVTGESLDDDKPLSEIKKRIPGNDRAASASPGLSVQKKPGFDWFDFFLKCGVNPQICERYAQAFDKDQMGEENLPDITPALLRTLGLKEGDILRVTKHLDSQYNRSAGEGGSDAGAGGLFSGPGGTLRNNTRKGRPAPPVETNNEIDAKAFEQKSDDTVKKPADAAKTPLASAPVPDKKSEGANGFDDNAWDVKPARSTPAAPAPAASPPPTETAPPAPKPAALTGSMGDLSLLDMPALKPEELPKAPEPTPAPAQTPAPAPAPAQQPQPTGATMSLFEQVAAIKALTQPQNMAPPRLRPQAPQQSGPGGLIAPPPQRASSAPQNPQQNSAFGPPPALMPQLTGYQGNQIMPQMSPQGQSMNNQMGMQQMQPQMTGFPQQNSGFNNFQQNGLMPQPTGFQQQQGGFASFQQPQPTGFQQPMQTGFGQQGFQQGFGNGSPFADPPRAPFQPQPTGFNGYQPSPLNPQATGVNQFLPPAIQPQPTGFGQSPPPMPPMPPMPSMPTAQPLMPQKTGPPPPVRFGVQQAKKLTPQPTGKASLANASKYFMKHISSSKILTPDPAPQNPFGF